MRRTCGTYRWALLAAFIGLVTLPATAGSTASPHGPTDVITCPSPQCPITINDHTSGPVDQAATPYPSAICCAVHVDGPPIDTIKVTLAGLTHGSLDNVDVLLAPASGPGPAVELMSDAGGPFPTPAPLTLTFDDAASASLPQGVPPTSGTYRPTNYRGTPSPCIGDNPSTSPNADPFPAPAPAAPSGGYSQALSSFHGLFVPEFRLFVGDDCAGGSGTISSWSLEVTHIPCSRLCLVKRADAPTVSAGSPIGFTLEASHNFHWPVPEDMMFAALDDPLPAGTGIDWSITEPAPGDCSITGAVGSERLRCNPVLRPGDSIQVHVSSSTSALSCDTYTNTATLSGFDPNSGDEAEVQDTTSTTVTGCLPTSARISSLEAIRWQRGVVVRWRAAADTDTLGFILYRKRSGRLVRLNRTLIRGSASGNAYSWLDRTAPEGATVYRLQAVDPDGTRHWVGATSVAR